MPELLKKCQNNIKTLESLVSACTRDDQKAWNEKPLLEVNHIKVHLKFSNISFDNNLGKVYYFCTK